MALVELYNTTLSIDPNLQGYYRMETDTLLHDWSTGNNGLTNIGMTML